MHKAQRLIRLMMLVNEKKRFTVRELVRETGVSRRTILRDLMELGELGVPLYSETGAAGGYRVLSDKVLPPISFTEQEALSLFFAAQSLQNYRTLPFDVEVKSALHKFYHHMSGEVRRKIDRLKERLHFWVPPREMELPYLKSMLETSLEPTVVEIGYEGAMESGSRTVQPLGVYTMNGLWYCQAFSFTHREVRVYRVDRIVSFRIIDDQSGVLSDAREPVASLIDREETRDTYRLQVEFTREGVRRGRSDPWMTAFLEIREDGTGRLDREMPKSYLGLAVRFFLGYGTDASVRSPDELMDAIRSELNRLVRQYAEEGRDGQCH